MVISSEDLKKYLLEREEQGHYEEVEESFMDRIVYTDNGVAKIREVDEFEDLEELYARAERNVEALKTLDVEHINTTHAMFEDYRGNEALVAFQPYTEPVENDEGWQEILENAQAKGIDIDAKPENFGIQRNKSGEKIRTGYRDVSDFVSVESENPEITEKYGLDKPELGSGTS